MKLHDYCLHKSLFLSPTLRSPLRWPISLIKFLFTVKENSNLPVIVKQDQIIPDDSDSTENDNTNPRPITIIKISLAHIRGHVGSKTFLSHSVHTWPTFINHDSNVWLPLTTWLECTFCCDRETSTVMESGLRKCNYFSRIIFTNDIRILGERKASCKLLWNWKVDLICVVPFYRHDHDTKSSATVWYSAHKWIKTISVFFKWNAPLLPT